MSGPARTPPRILVVATRFPLASETFVRTQCLALLDALRARHADASLEILALSDGGAPWSDAELAARLPACVRHARFDAPLWSRLLRAPDRALRLAFRSPVAAWRASAPWRGARACNGSLLAAAEALGAPARYDAVLAMFGPAGNIAVELRDAGLVAGPISVGFYGYDLTREPRRRGDALYARLFEEAALLLPNSAYLGDRLRALGAPAAKIRVHRLGIDPAGFPEVDRRGRQGPVQALAVGRFVEKKGFEVLLRAFAAADLAGRMTLRLVGDGPLRGRLEALAAELGLGGGVRFEGWRTSAEVAAAMAESDLLVTPSITAADGDMEGLPVVILEAMATGLPVIATRHSGNPEIVDDGRTGWVVDEASVPSLARALAEALDRSRLLERGEPARQRILAEFDARALAERSLEALCV
jgi:colanic acid/amylovoran biosynthesis glycosyltransferase